MEPGVDEFGGGGGLEMGFGLEEIHGLIAAGRPLKQGSSSFTALLELPPPQAVELLVKEDLSDKPTQPPFFPCAASLSDRASKFSVSASADDSLENTAGLSGLSSEMVKQEPLGSNFHQNSSSNLSKRKHGEKEVKEANKRIRKDDAIDEHGEKLPYVHVRARRGQATDSHSLAERARREKINARMKLLQELVPGCNKISGTALVLDEIINHVQALQRQVEFLSMTLAAVDPGIDFNLDCLLGAEIGTSSIDNSHSGLFPSEAWLENPMKMSRHQYQQPWNLDAHHHHLSLGKEEDLSNPNFSTPENSLLSYGSPANSASQHSNHLKTEL